MKNNLIIFDLDGTLLDTSRGIVSAIKDTCQLAGKTPIPESVLRSFIGPPIYDSFKNYYELSDEDATQMMNIFRKIYIDKYLFLATKYDGIDELLNTLKKQNYKLGVATNKREDYTNTILEHFGLYDYFNAIHGSDSNNKLTKSDLIERCCRECNADYAHSIMVGDTIGDYNAAKQCGIKFIAVSYGFGFVNSDESCDSPYKILDKIGLISNC